MKKLCLLFLSVLMFGMTLHAQISASGVVLSDSDGQPVVGATIVAKGTSIGTVTDLDGKFKLEVPANIKTIVISYVGMRSVEQPVGSTMRVVLQNDSQIVDEVVIAALGISRSQKSIGYAATNVSADDIMGAKQNNVVSSLAGKVAGVQVSASGGDPGSSNAIIIRGVSSLTGSNQPLFVVDGVPLQNNATFSDDPLNNAFDFGNGANSINPADVENMTILKGAAATALYGSRAANGVVMITTKSGKGSRDKLNIDFNHTTQMSNILRLPTFQNEFGMGWDGYRTVNENGSWGPRFDGVDRVFGTIYNNSQQKKPYVALPNNVKDFFETGWDHMTDLSLSGTSGKASYYASFSANNNNGMLPTDIDTYERYTIALRGSYDFKYVKISSAFNWADQTNSYATTGQGLSMINSIYQTPRDISIVDLKDLSNPFNTPDYYYTPYSVTNPYYLLAKGSNKYHQTKTYGKVELQINPIEKLSVFYRLGFDYSNSEQKFMQPVIEVTAGSPNYSQFRDPLNGKEKKASSVEKTNNWRYEINHDLFAIYTDKWGDFDLGATVGVNINQRGASSTIATVNNLTIPGFNDLSNSSSSPSVLESTSMRRLIGIYADVQLSYANMIFLGLTARNDWSSTLPLKNNSFFYPGITASWIFTELMDKNDVLTFGKLRLAYGMTGNDAGVYMTNPYFVQGYAYEEYNKNSAGGMTFPFNGVNAYRIGSKLASATLSPEITTEYEAGLNLNFWKGRIQLDAAYYYRVSDKQIFSLNVDPAVGYSKMNTNLGKVSNQGIELMLNVVPVRLKDFSWTLGATFTKNWNKVESLPEELGGEINLYGFGTDASSTYMVAKVGNPIGDFMVTQPKMSPQGKIVVNSITGRPVANTELTYAGNINHDFEMGFNTAFSYKSFTLSANFDWRVGGKMYSRTKDINYFVGNSVETLYNDRNTFIVPHSVNEVNGVYVENTTPISNEEIDDYFNDGADKLNASFLIDRTYFKMRNLSLSYDFPSAWVRQIKLQGIRLSAFGNNLFVITPSSNSFIDPEVSSFGNDLIGKFGEYTANPTPWSLGLSLNVKF